MTACFPPDGPQGGGHQAQCSVAARWPDPLRLAAYPGVLGEWLDAIEPHTEADPAALLLTALCYVGNVVGRAPHFVVDGARHGANTFVVVVADTSRGRKGTSQAHARNLLAAFEPAWASRTAGGLSSGEGLIYHVRDPGQRIDKRGVAIKDPGRADHRLMVVESEFGRVLTAMARQGNTLSATLRQAWDGDTLRTLTRGEPLVATDAHVSVLGHITGRELASGLDDVALFDGLGNRILWCCARRQRSLPFGGEPDGRVVGELGQRLAEAVQKARRSARCYHFTAAAHGAWPAIYDRLTGATGGVLGAVTARSEAQVRRLALIYAIADGAEAIDLPHLCAALEVIRYTTDSARWIFGEGSGDPVQDRIANQLECVAGDWVPREAIRRWFAGHQPAHRIDRALEALEQAGKAESQRVDTDGRPRQEWRWIV